MDGQQRGQPLVVIMCGRETDEGDSWAPSSLPSCGKETDDEGDSPSSSSCGKETDDEGDSPSSSSCVEEKLTRGTAPHHHRMKRNRRRGGQPLVVVVMWKGPLVVVLWKGNHCPCRVASVSKRWTVDKVLAPRCCCVSWQRKEK